MARDRLVTSADHVLSSEVLSQAKSYLTKSYKTEPAAARRDVFGSFTGVVSGTLA